MKTRTRSFLDGIGSSLDMFPKVRTEHLFSAMRPPKSDAEALADDWNSTGNDLGKAILFQINTQPNAGKPVTVSPQLSFW